MKLFIPGEGEDNCETALTLLSLTQRVSGNLWGTLCSKNHKDCFFFNLSKIEPSIAFFLNVCSS